jgi:putative tricarboxylic transport membrane protein
LGGQVTQSAELLPAGSRPGATTNFGFWLGLIALVVANVAMFVAPVYGVPLSFVACTIAALSAAGGDRFFSGAAAIVSAGNWFLLNSAYLSGAVVATIAALLFAFAPIVVLLLRNAGMLAFAGIRPDPVYPPGFVRNPQDFFGGVALLELAIFAWRASTDLPGQSGFAFGPGTAPRLFIGLLALNAIGIILHGLAVIGPPVERYAFRGPFWVTAAILVFAATIRTLGLVISTFLLVLISSVASPEIKGGRRWIETIIWGAVLAAFCAVLFPYVLNLPMQLWPRF